MATDFERALEFTLHWEGGYVNHPNDPGGRTDGGISEAAHPEVWRDGKVTYEEKRDTLRAKYWDMYSFGSYPWPQSAALFDFAVNSGGWREVVEGLAAGDAVELALQVCAVRRAYLIGLAKQPKLKTFKKGWMRRVESMRRFCRGEEWR